MFLPLTFQVSLISPFVSRHESASPRDYSKPLLPCGIFYAGCRRSSGWLAQTFRSAPVGPRKGFKFVLLGAIISAGMPLYHRQYSPGELQFITSSVYRRRKLFDSHRLRTDFAEALRQYRQEAGFLLIGWLLMPEHFHLLIKAEPAEGTSRLMQEFEKRTGGMALVQLQVLLSRIPKEPRTAG